MLKTKSIIGTDIKYINRGDSILKPSSLAKELTAHHITVKEKKVYIYIIIRNNTFFVLYIVILKVI